MISKEVDKTVIAHRKGVLKCKASAEKDLKGVGTDIDHWQAEIKIIF